MAQESSRPLPGLLVEPNMNLAAARIPHVDVDIVMTIGHQRPRNECEFDEEAARVIVANIRLQNPICERCWKKTVPGEPHVDLYWCAACSLGCYCSRKCQKEDWERHRARCCVPDGPRDDGPMRLAFIELKE